MKKHISGTDILKGSAVLGCASIISKIIGVVYRIPLTNILGDIGVATYASAYQIYVLLLAISSVGIPSAIARLVSECISLEAYTDARRVYKIAMVYMGILSGLLGIGLWIGSDIIAYSMNNRSELALPLKALAPTVFIVSIVAVMRGYYQGLNNMLPTAISQIVEQGFNGLFSVVFAFYLVQYGVNVAASGSAVGTGVGALAGLIVLLIIGRRIRNKDYNIKRLGTSSTKIYSKDIEILKKILKTVIPITLTTSIFSLMTIIDNYLLVYQLPHAIEYLTINNKLSQIPVTSADTMDIKLIVDSLIGQFLNKYIPLINIPVSAILIIATATIPAIASSMVTHNIRDIQHKTNKLLRLGMLIALPSSVGLMVLSRPIINVLYPNAPDGSQLLMYGSMGIIFITIAQLTTSILQGMGKQIISSVHAIIACLVKLICDIILLQIPSINIYAVVHSTTICYLCFALLNVIYLKKTLKIEIDWRDIGLKPLLSTGVMGGIVYIIYSFLSNLTNDIIALSISIMSGVISYMISGFLSRTFTAQDISYIPYSKKIIKHIKMYIK